VPAGSGADEPIPRSTTRVALVLGAGGTVGLSYHAGALRALERVGGYRANDAELIVGTSAGSVVGAYLRSGWGTEDFWQLAMGTHPSLAGLNPEEVNAMRAEMFTPRFRTGPELVRRLLGSSFVIGRSVLRTPAPVVPGWMRRLFPGGLFDMADGRRRFAADLPLAWPARPLWLCAVDITSGRRIVLGHPGAPPADLQQAVMASCAIPGLYQPIRLGGLTLVDGGAHSNSNLDLAGEGGFDLVIGVAPMAFDTTHAPGPLAQLVRRLPARQLAAEASLVRSRGGEVLLIRPTGAEVRAHGFNLMRSTGWDRLAVSAYDATARALETPRFRRVLDALAA
jgi:NTE family protein